MLRRKFMQISSLFGVAAFGGAHDALGGGIAEPPVSDREYWIGLLDRIASPVLVNMSRGELVRNMRVQVSPVYDKRDPRVAYMEAFGRLIAGLAPFLALPIDASNEGKVRKRLLEQTLQSFI